MNAMTDRLSDWKDSLADHMPEGSWPKRILLVLCIYLLLMIFAGDVLEYLSGKI